VAGVNKRDLVREWLPRYTGTELKQFEPYVLLVNFQHYIESFARKFDVPIRGMDRPMQTATAAGITVLKSGIGSPMAATAMDLLSAVRPRAALLLGKCGGLKKKTALGDLILPIAALRGEATSNEYMDPVIPALPSFALQRALSSAIVKRKLDYWTGTVYSTNRRVWEWDDDFQRYLRKTRAMAIDMETATVFVVGFMNEIPRGALLLVSDNPLVPEGVKTSESDRRVNKRFVESHLQIGIEALTDIAQSGESVKHLRFEDEK